MDPVKNHLTLGQIRAALGKYPQDAVVYVQISATKSQPLGWSDWAEEPNQLLLDHEPDIRFAPSVQTALRGLQDESAPGTTKVSVMMPEHARRTPAELAACVDYRPVVGVSRYRNRVTLKTGAALL